LKGGLDNRRTSVYLSLYKNVLVPIKGDEAFVGCRLGSPGRCREEVTAKGK
jgi:hypothetical protein